MKLMLKPVSIISLFFYLLVLIALNGCGEEPVKSAPPASSKKAKATKGVSTKKVEDKAEKSAPSFIYSPVGQRDPFASLLEMEKNKKIVTAPRTPLEKFDLGQFRIQAILIGKGAPRAMVSAPDGKNYILKPGLNIGKNNGVIKTITKTSVVVEESTSDYLGNPIKGLQTINIPEQKSF